MTEQGFVRARRPEHKRQRREAILDAARELALRSGVRAVSLGGVAAAAGLAKSNVGRYFGTREEIYLELAAEAWRDWGDEVAERLRDATGAREVVDALAETLVARPFFCDLLGHMSTSLEHNVSVPAARAYKRVVLDVIAGLAALVVRAHPTLTESEAFELVGAAAGVAGMLYPVSNPSPVLVELYAQDPDIAAACPPFLPTMKRTIMALIAGLPTLR
ncbi:TetR/AcrR family transcriptional regulator [Sphaerisporangium perillae]|uniref:TetR/AcrR family transcriptional regulator n=1 Tax=Sphaerisporangium perillae TaxID=2935860 RepID=UPI002010124E|nr:TetR/AcrR family transcriptional regulator [Sphaerisporangium perillae]